MSASSIYTEPPFFGSHRIFELRDGTLTVETFTNDKKKSETTIELVRVSLPSMRVKGRSPKVLKGSASVLLLIAVIGVNVNVIFSVNPTWIWVVALALAVPFVLAFFQALKVRDVETFKDEHGAPLFDLTHPTAGDLDFDSFRAALIDAIQKNQVSTAPAAASGVPMELDVATTPPPIPQPDLAPFDAELLKKIKSGAHWLYWVAALSGINVLLAHTEATWRFAIGLGITELIYAIGLQFGALGTTAGAITTISAVGCLVGLGYAATKHQAWAFIVGIIALTLDTLLLVALTGAESMVGIIFHIVAVVCLCMGYKALRTLQKQQGAPGAL
ncbi:hypothetical protein M2103_000190 [Ereboglobus sp. PH5-5]|uniref:hypothetical protein n=1 Tax=Ereboglobus sp. PH5-5 TaxID=2940529 RepID=UPI002406953E|nr:hypothetical protein [Ereboglobus sp. PH5-5]MDF9831986.1 hypothetical protein [Ereboglobus sp. PH5-5]